MPLISCCTFSALAGERWPPPEPAPACCDNAWPLIEVDIDAMARADFPVLTGNGAGVRCDGAAAGEANAAVGRDGDMLAFMLPLAMLLRPGLMVDCRPGLCLPPEKEVANVTIADGVLPLRDIAAPFLAVAGPFAGAVAVVTPDRPCAFACC